MHYRKREFLDESVKKAFDKGHRNRINFNIGKYNVAVEKGKKQFSDLELAKNRASATKIKVINNFERLLVDFASNFEKNGGKIIWAQDAKEAVKGIVKVIKDNSNKLVVKSKSMTTEEIELNENLEKKGFEVLETDLGEYIVQVAGEKPYHIVTPAMHKSKVDIAELFHEKFGLPNDSTAEEITLFVRKKLREKFTSSEIGITGGNFLLADTGSVCLTENEGNAFLSFSFPKIHIAIAGIEKLIPSINDLSLFWPLLASFGTGQNMTVYNSIISGPKRENETDGPEEMYLVLLDNGRTDLLKEEKQKIALSCIRCGACLNACPVYRNIGGHTYKTTYSGPICSVITPFIKYFEEFNHLSYASSLCGKCTDVCPVKIPLHDLLLYNRNHAVKQKFVTGSERLAIYGLKKTLLKRKRMDMFGAKQKALFMRIFLKKAWGPNRELPRFARKSFRKMWLKRES
ncbi:MAG: lactate utilization protein [Bacteroidales bacterium]|nr:lactate utilization protein [Bacteroidales bacterium]